MKKLIALALAFACILCLFTGCVNLFPGETTNPSAQKPATPSLDKLYADTIAVAVGDHELTAVDLNYFYIDAINNYINQNYYYINLGLIKLDMTTPLNQQIMDAQTEETWADYFLNEAITNIKSSFGLYDLAIKANHKLTTAEELDLANLNYNLQQKAKKNQYTSVEEMLKAFYGNGANIDSYLRYYRISTYAKSYYNAYYDALTYTSAQLREFEGNNAYKYNSYSYATYLIQVDTFLPNGDIHTDEQKKAAQEAAKELADALAKGEYADLDAFDAAIDAAIKEAKGESIIRDEDEKLKYTSTKANDVLYGSLNTLFKDWLIGKVSDDIPVFESRKEGDLTVVEKTTGSGESKTVTGYYVVRFESVNDNIYALANVRHILVKFTNNPTNNPTLVEINNAKVRAEQILSEFESGPKTEDRFSSLASQYTDDSNKDVGGLYENVYPGQMVTNFNNWCFDETRKPGDYGMIQTEYGFHLMYYVGESETTFRDFMVSADMRDADITSWYEGLVASTEFEAKNLTLVNLAIVLRG
mgnify:CR=1 FL=1